MLQATARVLEAGSTKSAFTSQRMCHTLQMSRNRLTIASLLTPRIHSKVLPQPMSEQSTPAGVSYIVPISVDKAT